MTLLETIFKLRPHLYDMPFIHAMWLEGSYATGAFHDNSDIDVWLDVDDGAFEETAKAFEQALQNLGILERTEGLKQYSDEPKLAKAKFYLKGKSADQRIELDIQSHERRFVFSRTEHAIVPLFDKDGTIRWEATARFTLPAVVLLLLVKDNKVLLMRRQNTSWGNGDYDLVAGHIDGNEYLTAALAREAKEEIGVDIALSDLHFNHLLHCLSDRGKEYLHMTFECQKWRGEPTILEPEKCDDLRWFSLDELPPNMTPNTKAILEAYRKGERYSEIQA